MGALIPRSKWLFGVLPFILVVVGSRVLVARVGDAAVRSLIAAVSLWSAATRSTGEGPPSTVSVVEGDAPRVVDDATPRASERGRKGAGGPGKGRPSNAHLFIPTGRLMGLTADELRAVRWAAIHDGRGATAGVRLSGVGGLGLGLAEGDVVTSIDGRPTRTEDDATAAGMAAWTSGESAVHATLLRKEQVVAVTVELPPRPTSSPM